MVSGAFSSSELHSQHGAYKAPPPHLGKALFKLLFVLFLMGTIFFTTSTSSLALLAFKGDVGHASAQGQLLLMMMCPSIPVFLLALCFSLVRESNLEVTARSLARLPLVLIALGEGICEALACVLFVDYVLAKAQGSIVLVMALALWTIGPMALLLLRGEDLKIEPHPYTPFGAPVARLPGWHLL